MYNCSDSRLASMLRKFLSKHYEGNPSTKGLQLCGSRIIKNPDFANAVFVVSDEKEHSDFFGTAKCNSTWACPICMSKVLAKKGTNIACLIDARAKWENLYAFMITFTIPHYSDMSCAQTYDAIRLAWRMFNRSGNRAKTDKGKTTGAWGEFRQAMQVQHIVRTYEFTHGKNGWHPHIHALFWTKPENFDKLASYESALQEQFWHCLKYSHLKITKDVLLTEGIPAPIIRETLQHDSFKVGIGARAYQQLLKEIDLDARDEELRQELDDTHLEHYIRRARYLLQQTLRLYEHHEQNPNDEACLWFSKNADNSVRKVNSSHYLVGWSGSDELTNLTAKTANNGHLTMPQLLVEAYESPPDKRDKLLHLFVEYAIATRGTKRVCFTPGDNQLIEKWKRTNEYAETFKKKAMDKVLAMHVVFWFTSDEWSRISYEELYTDYHIKDTILELARAPDCEENIIRYLAQFSIHIAKKKVHPMTDVVNALFVSCYEEQLMNNTAETDSDIA